MPWHSAKTTQCPVSKPWGVIKDATGQVIPGGCHPTKAEADAHVAALYANEPGAKAMTHTGTDGQRAGGHDPMQGSHSHPHPANGSQGGDVMHSHEHPHAGDADHGHPHEHAQPSPGGEQRAGVDNSPWDAGKAWANGAASDNPAAFYNGICAGKKAGDPATQAAHALPHHYHPGDPPNAAGVANAQGRIGATQGLTNKAAAQAHLDGHSATIQAAKAGLPPSEGGRSARGRRADQAELRYVARARAAGVADRRQIPNGPGRAQGFGTLLRSVPVLKDGQQWYEVEGKASVVDTPYEMFDMFGPYDETVTKGSFDTSLAIEGLDVAFLVNHKGLTMARTKNGSLALWADPDLSVRAFLNADRQDVRDLVSGISDGLVDEMSFAFWLRSGYWSDDYLSFYIEEADIHRGDVSAVNYGASPWTSIAARSSEILSELDRIPAGAARAAVNLLLARSDLGEGAPESWSAPGRQVRGQDVPPGWDEAAHAARTRGDDGGLVGYQIGGRLYKPEDVELVRTWDQAPATPDGLFPAPAGAEAAQPGMSVQMLAMQQEIEDDLDGS